MDATIITLISAAGLAISAGFGKLWFSVSGTLKECVEDRKILTMKVDALYATATETAVNIGRMQEHMATLDTKSNDNADQIVKVVKQVEVVKALTPANGIKPIKL